MRLSTTHALLAVLALASASVFAQVSRRQIDSRVSGDAPQVVRANGQLATPQERAPSDAFGVFVRSGLMGATDGFGKAYKKKIDKSQITGPLELSIDHLTAGPDRYLEILGADTVVPGAAKIPVSPSQTKGVRLHFAPFKANVPHLLLWHMDNFHKGNPQTYFIKGSGINVKHEAAGGSNQPIGIVVVPMDTSPITLTVSASSGYWWRFYGVEVSMLNN